MERRQGRPHQFLRIDSRRSALLGLVIFVSLIIFAPSPTTENPGPTGPQPELLEEVMAIPPVDYSAVMDHVEHLQSLGTRHPGTEGYYKSAEYVMDVLEIHGLEVRIESFNHTVLVDDGSSVTVAFENGTVWTIDALTIGTLSVETASTPPEGVSGELVYAGRVVRESIVGRDFSNKIVLAEFNSKRRWADLVTLGAKAFIFVEPERYTISETFTKDFLYLPVDIPRVVISSEFGNSLKSVLGRGEKARVKVKSVSCYEERTLLNAFATIPGSDTRDEAIMVIGHFDSFSPIPGAARGAGEATGVALMLEFANYFSTHSPKRNLTFAFFSGHGQMLAGARYYLDRHLEELANVPLVINIDVSGYSESISLYETGAAYVREGPASITSSHSYPDKIKWAEDAIKYEIIEPLVREYGSRYERYAGATKERLEELRWELILAYDHYSRFAHYPSSYGFYIGEHEPFTACGGIALAITDAASENPLYQVYTPSDTIEEGSNVSKNRFTADVAFLSVYRFANGPVENHVSGPHRLSGQLGFTTIEGRVSEYDESRDAYVPVPNALVIVGSSGQTRGITRRLFILTIRTDENGHFEVPGLLPGSVASYSLGGFVDEPLEGPPEMLPDGGSYAISDTGRVGTHKQPHKVELNIFRGGIFAAFDVMDPESSTPEPLFILPIDHITQEEALGFRHYASMAVFNPMENWGASLAFLPETRTVDLLYLRTHPTLRVIGVLNNGTEDNPFGSGYRVKSGEMLTVPMEASVAERTMDLINSHRMSLVEKNKLYSPMTEIYYKEAKKYEKKAAEEFDRTLYPDYEADLKTAWGFQAGTYEVVVGLLTEAASTTYVYLMFLLPFAFMFERLIFEQKEPKKRLAAVVSIFVVFVLALYAIHPGFRITRNFGMVGLVFLMTVFGGLSLGLILLEAYAFLKEIRIKVVGIHELGISKTGAATSAFLMGIRNMKRRKLRSFLVIFSIVMVTAAMVSSVTIATALLPSKLATEQWPTLYNGLLVRQDLWRPLSYRLIEALRGSYPNVVQQSAWSVWVYPPLQEQYISALARGGHEIRLSALLGVIPEEVNVTGMDAILVSGSWIDPEDLDAVLVDEGLYEGVSVGDKITLFGVDFYVKGIYDGDRLAEMIDVDKGALTPNTMAMQQRDIIMAVRRTAELALEYYGGREIAMINAETAEALGGSITVMRMKARQGITQEQLFETAEDIALRTKLSVYAGYNGTVARFSPSVEQQAFGFSMFVVLMLILVVTILNTMISAVYERKPEIFTYSSVGMSPMHVGSLFLAQALTVGTVGAMLGYVLGTSLPLIFDILKLPLLSGVYPNYTSFWVPGCLLIVAAVTALSTLYPMRKASTLVTPSIPRQRELPPPSGDEWFIPLPFTSSRLEVDGLIKYLIEYITAYGAEKEASFVADEVDTKEEERGGEIVKSLVLKTKHSPWDLDIRNEIWINAVSAKEGEEAAKFDVYLRRIAGYEVAWRRAVKIFVGNLRQQFLVWRALKPEEKARYIGVVYRLAREEEASSEKEEG